MTAAWLDGLTMTATQFAMQAGLIGGRLLVTLVLFWGLHLALKHRLAHRIIRNWPTAAAMRRDAVYSVGAVLVSAATALLSIAGYIAGVVDIYLPPAQYGWLWLAIQLPLLLIWQDTWFFWTHRFLHRPWWFKRVHYVHHLSRDPSPFTGYAFHPIEACVHALTIPLALLVLPLNAGVVLVFGVHQIIRNLLGHSAIEVMPSGLLTHPVFGLLSTTTHHHLHHEDARGNYALWFSVWDRVCKTEHPDYTARFLATASRPTGQTVPAVAPQAG